MTFTTNSEPTTLRQADGAVIEGYVSRCEAHRNKAAALRALARRGQYGHSRTPAGFYMPDPGTEPPKGRGTQADTTFCAYSSGWASGDMTHAQWCLLARLSVRYHRFHRHMTEVAPGWTETGRTNWADNSTDSHQVCKHGTHTRTVQLVAPHGDTC